ncbi:hypothetical protein GH714_013102 [Hevea brasiliensis]|uniref:Uncharacterized protein n=2 Tax=Hevea brasiliensis TaxID=3981 RepID=A0A6A6LJE4_HEVBR|nr:hypothetical protein GH714_012892 [Hevea brasiliensis]KAF2300418.1 hypothetical protein GH714_013102 [Hevea brasiliensis]
MPRWFDPWPVFFKREFNRNWPFLVGFAVTGTLITKFSLGLTEEDAKKSPFVQRHKRHKRTAIRSPNHVFVGDFEETSHEEWEHNGCHLT